MNDNLLQNTFEEIYHSGLWGRSADPQQKFYSGAGSHDPGLVGPYVAATSNFLVYYRMLLGQRPAAVDLGCGDFSVGAQLRPLCGGYVACDVTPSVIEWNRGRYADAGVDFRTLDMTTEDLPPGDVVFIRQVLQHLSNEQIARVLPKLAANYRYLVLTEHLPAAEVFPHNLDKAPGANIRLERQSGVVLTSAPFDLRPREAALLCDLPYKGSTIRTLLYKL